MFLLADPAAATAPQVKSALRKLLRALPGTLRADAQAAAEAVVIDPARWGSSERPRPELVKRLQSAVLGRRKVRLAYASRAQQRTERLVDPLGLVDKDEVSYLLAGTERGQRTFRVERILDAELTELPAERSPRVPPGHRVAAGRRTDGAAPFPGLGVGAHPRQVRTRAAKPVRAPLQARRPARRRAVRTRVAAHTARGLAEQVAGWGAAIEVVEPESVRSELARIGSELAQRYTT